MAIRPLADSRNVGMRIPGSFSASPLPVARPYLLHGTWYMVHCELFFTMHSHAQLKSEMATLFCQSLRQEPCDEILHVVGTSSSFYLHAIQLKS